LLRYLQKFTRFGKETKTKWTFEIYAQGVALAAQAPFENAGYSFLTRASSDAVVHAQIQIVKLSVTQESYLMVIHIADGVSRRSVTCKVRRR